MEIYDWTPLPIPVIFVQYLYLQHKPLTGPGDQIFFSSCFYYHAWYLDFSFGCVYFKLSDLRHTIPSCTSGHPPTDGTLRHTWALITPLICAHIKILRFLFRQSDTSSPPCVVQYSNTLLFKDAPPPPRNALATLYHWLYWEHLMAQSWWILWEVDLLITVLGCEYSNSYQSPPEITFPHSSKVVNGFCSAPQVTLRQ